MSVLKNDLSSSAFQTLAQESQMEALENDLFTKVELCKLLCCESANKTVLNNTEYPPEEPSCTIEYSNNTVRAWIGDTVVIMHSSGSSKLTRIVFAVNRETFAEHIRNAVLAEIFQQNILERAEEFCNFSEEQYGYGLVFWSHYSTIEEVQKDFFEYLIGLTL